jgi:hypothetical protein
MSSLGQIKQNITDFTSFIVDKLKNFKNLTLYEQISFGGISGGLFLIFISIILFIF